MANDLRQRRIENMANARTFQAKCKYEKDGTKCNAIAMRISGYCYFHTHRLSKESPRVSKPHKLHTTRATLTTHSHMFYASRLGPKLKQVIEEQCARPTSEQLAVTEEVAVIRSITLDALALYDAAIHAEVSVKCPQELKNELIMSTGSIARDAAQHVIKACEIAARIDAMGKDKIDASKLDDVAKQITYMVRECFDNDTIGMEKFDRMITEELRLPSIGDDIIGTKLRPDMDVLAMDASVPLLPPVETETE